MMLRFILTAGLLCLSTAVKAQVFKFECVYEHPQPRANGTLIEPTVRLIELNATTKQVWLIGSPPANRFGPFRATITPEKITWSETFTKGRASSTTNYTLERKNRTLNIHIIYNAFMEQDPWDQMSPCKPG
jgi:hypothetical protein